jgi:hypothetical protein
MDTVPAGPVETSDFGFRRAFGFRASDFHGARHSSRAELNTVGLVKTGADKTLWVPNTS